MTRTLLLTLLFVAVGFFAVIFIKDTKIVKEATASFNYVPVKINIPNNNKIPEITENNNSDTEQDELNDVLPSEEKVANDDSAIDTDISALEGELDDLGNLDDLEASLDI